VFATHELSPAKIAKVSILDGVEKHMEVIVDDTQLSLAIGKKGQNVRLAAKLLGWRIDIKSEEEKRQEVESQMAAMVVPGAPVSVLLDHGLTDETTEKLMAAGVLTVEKLGEMTPEQLEEIPGIDEKAVESIQQAVVSYYGQFEGSMESPAEAVAAETAAVEPAAAEPSLDVAGEVPLEVAGEPAGDVSESVVDAVEQENQSVTIEGGEPPAQP